MTDFSRLKLQNELLTQEVKRRVDQLAAINTVAATVSQSLDLDVTLDTALMRCCEIVGAEAGGHQPDRQRNARGRRAGAARLDARPE